MAKKKIKHEEVVELAEKNDTVFFKAKRPLTEDEHKLLSDWIRYEAEQVDLKIVLVPFSVDVEVDGETL
ncbi:hypothetical protein J7E79_02725 [Bacillus sp. ISL-40]|uniref:hypothetical protein n=1 Tax=unclassified Bacillus (in: firmicutes) TaxID=185979 RepID=UPI001BE81A48|nr:MULTISPECIES: hypothetical protein [unclassified Bacillus (in: firmicutes)]MBT2696350.1 hypothetical protein [Bacillus sp. ISL-40]MBT2743199.1 hypothetical protein [Bacillus sp. ISL-77]